MKKLTYDEVIAKTIKQAENLLAGKYLDTRGIPTRSYHALRFHRPSCYGCEYRGDALRTPFRIRPETLCTKCPLYDVLRDTVLITENRYRVPCHKMSSATYILRNAEDSSTTVASINEALDIVFEALQLLYEYQNTHIYKEEPTQHGTV